MERRANINVVVNEWKEAEDWQDLRASVKQFLLLMLISFLIIIVVGLGAYVRQTMLQQYSINNLSIELSEQQLRGILAEELSHYGYQQQLDELSLNRIGLRLVELMTGTTFLDPASIVSSELLYQSASEQMKSFYSNKGIVDTTLDEQPLNQEDITGTDINTDDGGSPAVTAPIENEDDKPVAFIYHTHNRESWNSELGDNERNAQSNKKNITLVGQRLADELEKLGLQALVSDTDYPTAVPNYEWEYSYKYSKKTVKEAIASIDSLQYIFDLHRDSQARKYTTAEINGESYAQVYFIIGQRNPNWKENESFARKLHNKLEAKYPGLSRGIWGKDPSSGNAEYNQSLSNQSVLIEIGGVDNTLEESYRTAKALAEVIAELHKES